jgi:rhomboid protease GluP
MWGLWNLGRLAERIFGGWTYLLTYTACGIAGSLTSLFFHPHTPGAGASGAIFGLVGALISALYLGHLPFPKVAMQRMLRSLLIVVAVNLYLGAQVGVIDNSAHIGGLVMGLALGAVLGPELTKPREIRTAHERVVFVAAAILLLGVGLFARRQSGWAVHLERARQAIKQGRVDEGIGELQQVLARKPDEKMGLELLSYAYLQKKDYPKAEGVLKRVLASDPEDPTAQYNLGLVYQTTDRYEEARELFLKLSLQTPENDKVWVSLGFSLKKLNRLPEAEQAFQQAVAVNPKNGTAFLGLGETQVESQQPDAAIDSFQHVLQLDPKNADAELGLSRAYLAKRMFKEAADAVKKYQEITASEQPPAQSSR